MRRAVPPGVNTGKPLGRADKSDLLGAGEVLVDLPFLPDAPTGLAALGELDDLFLRRLAASR